MKIGARNNSFSLTALILFVIAMLFFSPAMASAEDYPGQGKDQLVAALDAAIARILDSGQYRSILNSDPVTAPLWVEIADCYPRLTEGDPPIEIYPFPQPPQGLLADIINNKRIRVGVYAVSDTPGTFHIWDNVNPALLRAIIDELGKGYGLDPLTDPIVMEEIEVYPPSSTLYFTRLNNGDFDISDFLGALGATANNKRRRTQARFTCTIYGTPWYIHVRDDSGYVTFDDVKADTTLRICVGQLSSRLSEDFFKNARGKICSNSDTLCTDDIDCSGGGTCADQITKLFTEDDLIVCSEGVRDGIYDAYFHFDPVPVSYPEPNDLRAIPMQISSGIPIWVAGEQSCEGLDVCKGDLDYDQDVDANDLITFLKDFVRSFWLKDCPSCVQGW